MDTPGKASNVAVDAPAYRSFVQDPGSAAYDPARKEEILRVYHERVYHERVYHERASLRGVSRIFGVSRNTLTRWLKKLGRQSFLDPGRVAT